MDVERARRVRREIRALCQSGLNSSALAARAERLLRTVIPFDRACWHNVDPATSMLTSVMGDSAPSNPLLPMLEYGTQDLNHYADLARAHITVAGLREVTRGTPDCSRRYREVLEPMHIADELTAAFVTGSACWGCARLYRSADWPPFDAVEIAFVASLAGPLAEGFRTALIATGTAMQDSPDGPGVVVLDDDGGVVSITPATERWLCDVIDVVPNAPASLPHVLFAIASHARAIAAGARADNTVARCRVPTRSGRWLVLHGERLNTAGEDGPRTPTERKSGTDPSSASLRDRGQTCVIIEPAPAAELAPLIVCAYGLTDREQQVTRCAVRGMATKEIASALGLSPYTVSDHLRLVFEKVSVSSRTELAARIFFDHYCPRIAQGNPLAEGGWFVEPAGTQDGAPRERLKSSLWRGRN
jgi:DNA-binding CsgD family transcriptional regulator